MSAIPSTTRSASRCSPAARRSESTKGWDDKLSGNVAKAKELLAGGGLRRHADRAACTRPTRRATTTSPPSAKAAAREGRLQGRPAADGLADPGVAPRQEGPARQGRLERLLHLVGRAPTCSNPVSAAFLNASCDKATFGWPCDAELEKLRDAYRQGDRSGQAEGDRRAGPAARAGVSRPTCRSASSPRRRRSAPTSTACCRRRRWRCGTWRRSDTKQGRTNRAIRRALARIFATPRRSSLRSG